MLRAVAIIGCGIVALGAIALASLTAIGWFWPTAVTLVTAFALWYFILTEPDEDEAKAATEAEKPLPPPAGSEGQPPEGVQRGGFGQTARKRGKPSL